MSRRPRGEGIVANKLLLVFILLLPWLIDAQQQQQPPLGVERISEYDTTHHAGVSSASIRKLQATTLSSHAQQWAKSKNEDLTPHEKEGALEDEIDHEHDVIPVKAVAPPAHELRAPSPRRSSILSNVGLPLQTARSLDDWEVEDFVLMVDVTGKVHARERRSGKSRWVLDIEKPILEAVYDRRNRSNVENRGEIDNYFWMIEPSADGPVLLYTPEGEQPGLGATGYSMKQLVDMAPHYEGPFIFIGDKQSELLTINASDGKILQWFGSKTHYHGDYKLPVCETKDDGLEDPDPSCRERGTLTLGRTEYTVLVKGTTDGRPIVTLKYAEWGPNNYDRELVKQHQGTIDGKYWFSRHDGSVFAFDSNRVEDGKPMLYQAKLPGPVVRVFDVMRPFTRDTENPELIVLPQPPPPSSADGGPEDEYRRNNRIFVNETDGVLYAMSGRTFPWAVDAPKFAECHDDAFWNHGLADGYISNRRMKKALIGLHSIDESRRRQPLLTISGPSNTNTSDVEQASLGNATDPAVGPRPSVLYQVRHLPAATANSTIVWLSDPITQLLTFIFFVWWMYQKRHPVRQWALNNQTLHILRNTFGGQKQQILEENLTLAAESAERDQQPVTTTVEERHLETTTDNSINTAPSKMANGEPEEQQSSIMEKQEEAAKPISLDGVSDETKPNEQAATISEAVVEDDQESPLSSSDGSSSSLETIPEASVPPIEESSATEERKKSRKRGKRGGKMHRKGPPSEASSVESAVYLAEQIGAKPQEPVPDVDTIPTNVSDMTGPILRMGNLRVDQDTIIGTGSNGTLVFAGTLGTRDVAVKRMLASFFEIAAHETKLLEESDIHPNVIRYYMQETSGAFLYIALELCGASLADVIEKPYKYPDMAESGAKNVQGVLFQIANGLSHLHDLRIVHRDLKPHNILVSMGRDGVPAIKVSDFGLCKKMEDEKSSFGVTTAHAAGTSGWRAPELLLDDDTRQGPFPLPDSSTNGNTNDSGPLVSTDLSSTRRATRAIDIFALGLVFFYVLTRGCHPFDCGDRYMREANIRKGVHDLGALDLMGDEAYEAKHLITAMLQLDPKRRPTAHEVKCHPFFWSSERRLSFLCDVSDHFEKEKRDPPSPPLQALEKYSPEVTHGDFLKPLGREFLESLGKQRKYTPNRMLDLCRALRNKKYHYEDMSESLKKHVGRLPEGYLTYWTKRFPNLLIVCWKTIQEVGWEDTDRFRKYFKVSFDFAPNQGY